MNFLFLLIRSNENKVEVPPLGGNPSWQVGLHQKCLTSNNTQVEELKKVPNMHSLMIGL
jgi:hypothetical protein